MARGQEDFETVGLGAEQPTPPPRGRLVRVHRTAGELGADVTGDQHRDYCPRRPTSYPVAMEELCPGTALAMWADLPRRLSGVTDS